MHDREAREDATGERISGSHPLRLEGTKKT